MTVAARGKTRGDFRGESTPTPPLQEGGCFTPNVKGITGFPTQPHPGVSLACRGE